MPNVRSRAGGGFLSSRTPQVLKGTLILDTQGATESVEDLTAVQVKTEEVEKSYDNLGETFGEVSVSLRMMRKEISELLAQEKLTEKQKERLGYLDERKVVAVEKLKVLRTQLNALESNGGELAERMSLRENRWQRQRIELLGVQARLYGDIESRSRSILALAGTWGSQVGLGGVEQAGFLGTDVLGAVEGFKLAKIEAAQLADNLEITVDQLVGAGSAFAAVGAGAAALIAIYKKQLERQKELREEMTKFVEAQTEYIHFIQTATTEDVQRKTEDIQNDIDAERANLQTLEQQKQQAQAVHDQYYDLVDRAAVLRGVEQDQLNQQAAALFDNLEIGGKQIKNLNELSKYQEGLNNVYGKTEDNLETLQTELERYVEGLDSSTVRLNTAKEKFAQVTDVMERAAELRTKWGENEIERIQHEVDFNNQLAEAQKAYQLTQDEYVDKIEELKAAQSDDREEKRLLQEAFFQGKITTEQWRTSTDALNLSIRESQQLIDAYAANFGRGTGFFGQAGGMAQFFSDLAQTAIEPIGPAVEMNAAAVENYQKMRKDWDEFLIGLGRDEEDYARDRARDLKQHLQNLSALNKKYAEDVVKQEQEKGEFLRKELADETSRYNEFLKDQQRAAEDHYIRLMDIESTRRQSILSAAAKLDAMAIWQAQQRAADDRAKENRDYDLESARRLQDYLDDVKQRDEERQEKLRAYDEAIQDLKDKHDQERADLIRKFNEQQALEAEDFEVKLQRMQEDFVREQTLTNDAFTAKYGIEQFWWGQLNLQTSTNMGNFVSSVNNALSSLSIPTNINTSNAILPAAPVINAGGTTSTTSVQSTVNTTIQNSSNLTTRALQQTMKRTQEDLFRKILR